MYTWAISGTKGSSGFGSVSMEQIDSKTVLYQQGIRLIHKTDVKPLEIVRAGLHWSLKMSKHMLPFELILGW